MLRIQDLKLPVGHTAADLTKAVLGALKIEESQLLSFRLFRQSLDARQPRRFDFVYTVDVEVRDENDVLLKGVGVVQTPAVFHFAPSGRVLPFRPVIVGTGPAGLFAGLRLARAGARPILLERGRPVEERVRDVERLIVGGFLDPESNVQFGEGGAGTFSDGKLNTLIHDPLCRLVLEEMAAAGAPPEILYKAKPHVGTDVIRETVKNLRRSIQELGGEFRFRSKVTDLFVEQGRVKGVAVLGSDGIESPAVLIAVGNAARDTFEMLLSRGVRLEAKPFSIGARIEHPRERIDRAQYGSYAGHPQLGSADYKMAHRASNGYGAYTFCMCPGGVVVAGASEPGGLATNGMSEFARDRPNSNSAVMVGVEPKDFGGEGPLAGVAFQRRWEGKAFALGGGEFRAPVQRVGDFMSGRASKEIGQVPPSYLPGVVPSDLRECLPGFVCDALKEAIRAFDRKLKGFALADAILTGVETRSSSPVRIPRDESYQSNVRGLFPAGEGAGYAGGIMSSAVDGLRAAEALLAENTK